MEAPSLLSWPGCSGVDCSTGNLLDKQRVYVYKPVDCLHACVWTGVGRPQNALEPVVHGEADGVQRAWYTDRAGSMVDSL